MTEVTTTKAQKDTIIKFAQSCTTFLLGEVRSQRGLSELTDEQIRDVLAAAEYVVSREGKRGRFCYNPHLFKEVQNKNKKRRNFSTNRNNNRSVRR